MAEDVAITTLVNIGVTPELSLATTQVSMGVSLSLLMQNAITAQRNTQIISIASMTQCCALMISVGAAKRLNNY